ncbi:Ribosomal-protein-S18p-alanine acetyltransferase [hydrothermal vent metagenome]|uniref:Ribosomal-protein-S18p-alanine acetyltransferase n=1 Tax=hydrothermal vent metagenome TaxID=652676 RepID=A0A1W1CP91_9ZZZZ
MKVIIKPINSFYRNIELRYLKKIIKIEKDNYQTPWSDKQLEESLNIYSKFSRVIVKNDEVVAYVFIIVTLDEAEILNIAVDKEYQKQSIATYLLKEVIKELKAKNIKKIFLEVRNSNLIAQELYKKLNFIVFGKREKYYSNGEDALLFQLNIKKL